MANFLNKFEFTDIRSTLFAVLWLVLICCVKKILLAGCWQFGVREKQCWLDAANRVNLKICPLLIGSVNQANVSRKSCDSKVDPKDQGSGL